MKAEIKTAIICSIIIGIGIITISIFYSDIELQSNTTNNVKINDKSQLKKAPDLSYGTEYINIPKNEIKNTIQGKVVLYDIWTYSCINCIRTLPYITDWAEKYNDAGLIIIGIHTPEFEFEKDKENVLHAVEKFGIKYPVILDNEKDIWNAFENRYWPRKYIADHDGYIRYDHIGEGAYKETEKIIQKLLEERSRSLGITSNTLKLTELNEFEHSIFKTPELYFGYKFASGRNQLGNENGFNPGMIVNYKIPEEIKQNYFYLDGKWKNTKDSMSLISDNGLILLKYHAKQVNIVASNNSKLEIILDGNPIPQELAGSDLVQNEILISEPRLYNIINSDVSESHELIIKINGSGFEIFTLTFG